MRKKKLIKKLRKIKRYIIPILTVSITTFALISAYIYFSDNSIKANYLLRKAQKLDDESPYGSREAIAYYMRAISVYEHISNRGAAVNAYIHLGLLHYKFGNIVQVERMVLNAIRIGGDDIPKPLKAKAYMLLASTAEPVRAKKYINEAIEISNELGQKLLEVKSYFILARIYEYKANFEEAKDVYHKAIKVIEELRPEDGFLDPEPIYSNLAELYAGEGANANAITYYEKALMAAKANSGHGVPVANYMKILGDLYQSQMQLAKACKSWSGSKEEYHLIGKEPPISVLQLSTSGGCQKLWDLSANKVPG